MELSEPELSRRLLDDAGPTAGSVERWCGHRAAGYADRVGALLVPDTALAAAGRAAVAADAVVDVAVVVSGGAGGLLAAGRAVPGVRLTTAYATLRDLDDLAGNARRVVAAAGQLGDDVEVAVGLPWSPGWEAAAVEVEAAGLLAGVRTGPRLAAQLAVLVELDLPYRVLPGEAPVDPSALLAATWVLVETGDEATARDLLTGGSTVAATVLRTAPDDDAGRIRRRLRGVAVTDVGTAAAAFAG